MSWKLEGRCGKVPLKLVIETLETTKEKAAFDYEVEDRRRGWMIVYVISVWICTFASGTTYLCLVDNDSSLQSNVICQLFWIVLQAAVYLSGPIAVLIHISRIQDLLEKN